MSQDATTLKVIAMTLPARKSEWEIPVEERAGRMESDIEYIKRDVTDMKLDIREMRHDIVGLRTELKDSMAGLELRMDRKINETKEMVSGLELRMEKSFAAMNEKMHESFAKVNGSIASLRVGRVADRVGWLLIAGAILGVMARGFGWL